MTGQTQSVPTTLAVQSSPGSRPGSRALAAAAVAWTVIALALWLAGFVLRRAVDGPVYQGLLGGALFLAAAASYLYLRRRSAAESQALAYLHRLAVLDLADRREPETAGAESASHRRSLADHLGETCGAARRSPRAASPRRAHFDDARSPPAAQCSRAIAGRVAPGRLAGAP